MVFGNVPKLHGLIGSGILIAAAAVPIGCGDEGFTGCEASRTCPGKGGDTGAGGDGGEGADTGGTSGSGASGRSGSGGSSGSSGSAGADDGGEGGTSTGGRGDGGAGEGGSGNDAGEGGEGGTPEPPDTTPPAIVSVSPMDGATGVRADVNLVVTFSEPMDRVTAQAAYQSADIAAGAVTFSWNTESTVLTINPNSDLAYADGGDAASVVARTFATQVTDTAEDEAGNRLATSFAWSFKTFRRISQNFSIGSVVRVNSAGTGMTSCPVVGLDGIGDNPLNIGKRLLVSGDISGLPEGIAEWELVSLIGNQTSATESLYPDFGPALVRHVSISPPESAVWATPTIRNLGTLSADTTLGEKSVDVREALADDYQNRTARNQMSQYLIGFERITDGDSAGDVANFSCSAFALRTRYLIP